MHFHRLSAKLGNSVSSARPTPRSRIGLSIAFTIGVLVWCTSAGAKGPGIRSGDVVLHPKFSVSAGYDTNFYRDSANDATSPVNPVTVLRLGTGLNIANRNPNRASVKLNVDSRFRYITASDADETLSELDEDFALDTVNSELHLSLLPKRSFTVDLRGTLRYTERPANEFIATDGFQRLSAEVGPDLRFRPGGRPGYRALEFRLGYRYGLDRNLNTGPGLGAQRGDKDTHKFSLLTQWKFFPKTALLLDVSYWLVNYRLSNDLIPDDVTRINSVNEFFDESARPIKDATPMRAELGLKGLITRRLSLTLRGGYSMSFNSSGDSYAGPIGRVNLDYRLEPRLALGLGYRLQLGDDGYANYFVLHRAFLKGTINLPARVSLNGRFGFDYYDYSQGGIPNWAVDLPDRTEPILRSEAGVGWSVAQWLTIRANWEFENNRSGFYYCFGDDPGSCSAGEEDRAAYIRHVVMLALIGEY